ncbi:cytochrome-c peroxidase [Flavicella sediminum]|uniref:cytochrome-c peroxidase n=1 Tax=Flavicella sediminum TaxID=2585141 RepID=UPI00111FC2C6|nr:cytochrome c peroxidase [Flavicella sediminum]
MRYKIATISASIIICLLAISSCNQKEKKAKVDVNSVYTPLPEKVISPKNNPSSKEKISLGKLLFYDPILSGNKDVACASCHHPEFGYAEALDLSIGVNGHGLSSNRKFKIPNSIPLVKRNAHTILNAAYNGIGIDGKYHPLKAPMFWDNREQSLEDQVLGPIQSLEEMRGTKISADAILDTLVNRLKGIPEYVKLFDDVFPDKNSISKENIAKAIACFERSLTTPNSRFDQFLKGDLDAISQGEKDGFELFKKAKCTDCHNGPMFTDYKIHVLGVPDNEKLGYSDTGYEKTYGFRTPTLRNLRYTAPYMHNGKFKTLQQVLEFYEDIASGHSENPLIKDSQLDTLNKGINLKVKDMSTIISFFNTLNSDNFDKEIPREVPSKLPVGGNIQ